MLKLKGHKFSSQTDTEVIAKLIGDTYKRIKVDDGGSYLRAAVEESMAKCEGTWVRSCQTKSCGDIQERSILIFTNYFL
jgi:glucosamine--fructose-6-phosphate aminotransferase (isomerizing)